MSWLSMSSKFNRSLDKQIQLDRVAASALVERARNFRGCGTF